MKYPIEVHKAAEELRQAFARVLADYEVSAEPTSPCLITVVAVTIAQHVGDYRYAIRASVHWPFKHNVQEIAEFYGAPMRDALGRTQPDTEGQP